MINWWGDSGSKMIVAGCLSLGFATYAFVTGCFPATARSGGRPICPETAPEAYWIGLIALVVIGSLFVWRGFSRLR
jgi:hypothetical protein